MIWATGRNFAAGMSGGLAYVLDSSGVFPRPVNKEMVASSKTSTTPRISRSSSLDPQTRGIHRQCRGRWVLDNWPEMIGKFVKLMPTDYKLALQKVGEEMYA